MRLRYSKPCGALCLSIMSALTMMWSVMAAGAQSLALAPLSLVTRAAAEFPFGPADSGVPLFSTGASGGITVEVPLPFISGLAGAASLGYGYHPTAQTAALNLLTMAVGPSLLFSPLQFLQFRTALLAGAYVGFREGMTQVNPFAVVEAQVLFSLSPAISLFAGAGYGFYPTFLPEGVTALYHGIGLQAGVAAHLGATKSRIEFREIQFDPIFPVLLKYYDAKPLGVVRIRNGERQEIRELTVSFFVKQYMEQPRVCAVVEKLAPGQEIQVPLLALFSDRIMEITEATKVTAEIRTSYTLGTSSRSRDTSVSARVLDRNAVTWDDDRKAAAFVTPRDPTVLRFAKNVASAVREEGSRAVNTTFRTALAAFEALSLSGIAYVVDPKTPYETFSANKFTTDYLQFPQQTLLYKAGDCDDLSILYAALLESVGIETAFVTVPGHIFMAFSLAMTPEEASRIFHDTNELLVRGKAVWLPVETTLVASDFLRAWAVGAKQWREHSARGSAQLIPMREAWKIYEPVGIGGDASQVIVPASSDIVRRYVARTTAFVEAEVQPQAEEIRRRLAERKNDPVLVNKLGILYARFGLYDRARAEFVKLTKRPAHAPALVNLGNICVLTGQLNEARRYYEQALQVQQNNVLALAGLARVCFEQGETSRATELAAKAAAIDPGVKEKLSFVAGADGGQSRAAATEPPEEMAWDDT